MRQMNRSERAAYAPKIRAARRKMEMSQGQLAAAAGTSQRSIGSIERGDTIPQPETLKRIIDALGMDEEAERDSDAELDVLIAVLRPLLAPLDGVRRVKVMPEIIDLLTTQLRVQAFNGLVDSTLGTRKAPQPKG